jgi:hypothetical protein
MFFSLAPLHPSPLDPIPSSPPPEVLEAMDEADRVYESLLADGCEVRFRIDSRRGVAIELLDRERHELIVLTPHQALELACGPSV